MKSPAFIIAKERTKLQQEMEFEAKNLLSEQEYQLLLTHFKNNQPKTQINYYFETEDFLLKSKGAALRIRELNNQSVLTLKQPKQSGLLETHVKLTEKVKNQWLNGNPVVIPQFEVHLNALGLDPKKLKYWGKLTTDRIEIIKGQTTIVLDKSYYNNMIDYELEIEADTLDKANHQLDQLLKTYRIERKETVNKIVRFFQTLN